MPASHPEAVGDVEQEMGVGARVVQHVSRQRPHAPVGQLQALVRLSGAAQAAVIVNPAGSSVVPLPHEPVERVAMQYVGELR